MLNSEFTEVLRQLCAFCCGKQFADERDFQRYFMHLLNDKCSFVVKCFSIETEETVKGFPDCLVFIMDETESLPSAALIEFKCIRNKVSKFRPMQLPFREKYKKLHPYVVAYSKDTQNAYLVNDTERCIIDTDKGIVREILSSKY